MTRTRETMHFTIFISERDRLLISDLLVNFRETLLLMPLFLTPYHSICESHFAKIKRSVAKQEFTIGFVKLQGINEKYFFEKMYFGWNAKILIRKVFLNL
jgi:hypothetical protein